MGKRQYLGDFEEVILRALLGLGTEAYGAQIHEAIETRANRTTSIGSMYITLDRLEGKGYVRSWVGEATEQRGGRPKRYYAIEAEGKRALDEAEEIRRQLAPGFKLGPLLPGGAHG